MLFRSELDDVNVSGIITTASLNVSNKLITTGIGISIANGAGNTAYIEGPSEIWIDPSPAGAGTTSGLVRIRGDLYVDGTEFIVDVDKVQLGDFRIGIATTAGTNAILDGAGLGIGSESIEKTITWNNATSALMSSENWNLASGKHYEINGTDVLTSNTLGSGVINSSLTSVGTLSALTVSGVITATTFSGNLTGTATTATNLANAANITTGTISSDRLTGSYGINITGNATTAGIATYTSEWILGANGSSDYTFTGPGFTGAENDPTLYLTRGQQYKFANNSGGSHPFRIQSTPNGSTGTQYNDGILNNDTSTGTLTWNVQFDAPDILYYQCTNHSGMGGKIYIVNAGIASDISINTTGIITATDFNSTSDARLKTNVQVIDDPLEKVLQINGVSFNWIQNNKPSMGVIADNIQEILPELVSDSDPKTVNYNGLIGLLIEVVKEQQTQIDSLNDRLSKLE